MYIYIMCLCMCVLPRKIAKKNNIYSGYLCMPRLVDEIYFLLKFTTLQINMIYF